MTDKQIVIDGVDVSGCECYNPNIKMDCLLHPLQSDACKNNPNCYYKQLKRKEQECEELNKEIHNLNSTIDFIKVTEHSAINKYNKLKQAVREIKKITEENIRIADLEGLNGVYRRGLAEQILQKCEVINDR